MLALTYQVFAVLCGWLEAMLYAKKGAESFKHNEHGGMMAQRVAALALAPVAVWLYTHWGWWIMLEVLPMALLFPLCHDEAYNLTRLWLKYAEVQDFSDWESLMLAWHEYRYGYQSPTTTARNDFGGSTRTIFAITGAVLLVALYVAYFLHLF
jgi:hypothetical protein